MPKTKFAKDFKQIVDDFNVATQRAMKVLADNIDKNEEDALFEIDEDEDVMDASLDRLYRRVWNDARRLDKESKDLEPDRKKLDDMAKASPQENFDKERAALMKVYKSYADKLEKSLEAFTLRVSSQLLGRKDLGPQFSRAAGILFTDCKKLDEEIDKLVSTELKRKPREVKKQEVRPSKFLADFKAILKKQPLKDPDAKVSRAVKEAEERLKRVDTNGAFDKVTQLCEAAQTTLKELMKMTEKEFPALGKLLKDLIADIDKYDNHMFLLGK